jgi:hypothetical protein
MAEHAPRPLIMFLAFSMLILRFFFLLSFFVAQLGSATTTNRTIDDEMGDFNTGLKPVYSVRRMLLQPVSCNLCPLCSLGTLELWT